MEKRIGWVESSLDDIWRSILSCIAHGCLHQDVVVEHERQGKCSIYRQNSWNIAYFTDGRILAQPEGCRDFLSKELYELLVVIETLRKAAINPLFLSRIAYLDRVASFPV